MSIVEVKEGQFDVALQNAGPRDVVLNLGVMTANGKSMYPRAIHFTLTGSDGKPVEFEFSKLAGVAGRLDDLIVALPVNGTYTLRLNLHEYCCDLAGVKLLPGHYRMAGIFEGKGAQAVNLDTLGVKLLNFWTGVVQSNPVEFDLH